MKQSTALVLTLTFLPYGASAKPWADMAPQEVAAARNSLAPFVSATVDCIAGAIPGNRRALDFARKRQWVKAAALTGKSCDQSFLHMKQAFDVAIEPGAGESYAAVTLRKELPGLLAKRVVLPAISQSNTSTNLPSLPVQDSENSETVIARQKLVDAASEKQYTCIRTTAADIVPYSNEGAETLATVIISKCRKFQSDQVDVAVGAFGLTKANAEKVVAEITDRTRQKVVEEIVTIRAAAAKAANALPDTRDAPKSPSDGVGPVQKSF